MRMRIAVLMPLNHADIQALLENREPSMFLYRLVRVYAEEGHEIIFITSANCIQKTIYIRHEKIRIYIVKVGRHGNLRALFRFSKEIVEMKKILRMERPDVVHAHWCYEFAMAALKYDATKSVVTLHDWPDVVCPAVGNFFWERRRKLGNNVLKRAVHVTGVSKYMASLYLDRFPDRTISIISNFINQDILASENEIIRHSPTIYTICNGFGKIKNAQKAMQAFRLIRESAQNVSLVMYGDGYGEGGRASEWARENKLGDGIIFKGNKERNAVLHDLEEGGILLHTSLTESFGMVLIEAMAKKVIVIAGKDSGAVPDVLGYGEYGILVDINNVDEIAKCVESVLENPDKYDYIIRKAYDYVKKEFLLDAIKDKYLCEYRKVCEREDDESFAET